MAPNLPLPIGRASRSQLAAGWEYQSVVAGSAWGSMPALVWTKLATRLATMRHGAEKIEAMERMGLLLGENCDVICQ